MEYNTCKTCGANNGHAGMLINGDCLNCYDTRKSGNLIIHADLTRTADELKLTANILNQQPCKQE